MAGGDVNGDGFADWVVGAYLHDDALPDDGAAYVYYGGRGAIDLTADGMFADMGYGWEDEGYAVACGDLDADGYDDVLVGAPLASDHGNWPVGQVSIVYGAPGPSFPPIPRRGALIGEIFPDAELGASIATPDENGDGYADAATGAPAPNNLTNGKAYLYLGTTQPITTNQYDAVYDGEGEGDMFGASL